jgi:hypothetical protein
LFGVFTFTLSLSLAHEPAFKKSIATETDHDDVEARLTIDMKNPEQRKAWIQFLDTYGTQDHGLGYMTKATNLKVPGLVYDAAEKTIFYQKEGDPSKTVCATDVRTSFLSGIKYETTGRCKIDLISEKDNKLSTLIFNIIP